jgi:hypothetical protein
MQQAEITWAWLVNMFARINLVMRWDWNALAMQWLWLGKARPMLRILFPDWLPPLDVRITRARLLSQENAVGTEITEPARLWNRISITNDFWRAPSAAEAVGQEVDGSTHLAIEYNYRGRQFGVVYCLNGELVFPPIRRRAAPPDIVDVRLGDQVIGLNASQLAKLAKWAGPLGNCYAGSGFPTPRWFLLDLLGLPETPDVLVVSLRNGQTINMPS